MLQLDVPLRTVTKDSNLCQLATALMVMQYYGDYVESHQAEADILAFNPFTANNNERHSQGMAIWLKQHGYDVFYAHHDIQVIDGDTDNLTQHDLPRLEAKLAELESVAEDNYQKKKILLDMRVIEAGCRFSTALSNLTFVDRYLLNKTPVILMVKSAALTSLPNDRSNHSIVITGKQEDRYVYNDNNLASPQTIDANRLLQAWYAAGAYLLVASRHMS